MNSPNLIDFAGLNDALLNRSELLVEQWLPGGQKKGREYVCADLNGGEGKSLSVNLDTGRWADFCNDDRGGDLLSLYAAIHGMSMGKAARELMDHLGLQRPASAPSPSPGHAPARPASAPRPAAAPVQAPAGDERPEPSEVRVLQPQPGEKRRTMWRPVVPVPAHAPPADFKHWHYTEVHSSWAYVFEGQLYGHVVRFETSDGGKEVLPMTWCVDESDNRGTHRWHFKQWEAPRPLYVPAGLLAADARLVPVVLVEGEKCAKLGNELLGHEFDFVSWPGGANAWDKADWSWLKGRVVYLWPDVDAKRTKLSAEERKAGTDPETKPLVAEANQPGMRAMVRIGSLLVAEQGCTVLMCPMPKPGEVPDGWDIADAVTGGWGPDLVRRFVRGARPFVAPDDAARARAGAEVAGGKPTPLLAGAGPEDEPAEDPHKAWRKALLCSSSGAIKAVRENVVLAMDGMTLPDGRLLTGAPEGAGVIGYNEFTNDVVKLKPAPWGSPEGLWTEVDELKLGEWLVRTHWLPSMPRGTLEEGVRMVAANHSYHPVRAYLKGLKPWDGTQRLNWWLQHAVLGLTDWNKKDPHMRYLARVGTWFLQAMVARVMEPGCKFDYMLILEGAQGMRKSTLLKALAGEYFADTGLVLGDKDSYQQLQGRWLYEFAELDSFGKADVTKIKSFVASASDYFRASFDRRAKAYPRQVVFGGTTNEDHYLIDATGNRRFWPVRVGQQIDIDWVLENRDQLFAEALKRWQEGARMYPTLEEERELFQPQQQQREVDNSIQAALWRYLNDTDTGLLLNEVTLVQVLGSIGIGVEKLGPGRFHEKQAAAALRKLGWTERKSSLPGRPMVFKRPEAGAANAPAAGQSKAPTQGNNQEGPDDCPF